MNIHNYFSGASFSENISQRAFYVLIALLILSAAGIGDSLYLSLSHGNELAYCNLIEGCDVVLKSAYAEVFGIPTAIFGIVYYSGVFLLCLFALIANSLRAKIFLLILPIVGVVASLGFIYIQAFELKAWCQYCLLSALISGLIFLLSPLLRKELSRT